jgi:hypothetical protein
VGRPFLSSRGVAQCGEGGKIAGGTGCHYYSLKSYNSRYFPDCPRFSIFAGTEKTQLWKTEKKGRVSYSVMESGQMAPAGAN